MLINLLFGGLGPQNELKQCNAATLSLGPQSEVEHCLWDPRMKCSTVFWTPERTAALLLVAELLILVAEPLFLVAEPLFWVAEPLFFVAEPLIWNRFTNQSFL